MDYFQELYEVYGLIPESLGVIKKEDIPSEILDSLGPDERGNLAYVDGFFRYKGEIIWLLNRDGQNFMFSDYRVVDASLSDYETESVPFHKYSYYLFPNICCGNLGLYGISCMGYCWHGPREFCNDSFWSLKDSLDYLLMVRDKRPSFWEVQDLKYKFPSGHFLIGMPEFRRELLRIKNMQGQLGFNPDVNGTVEEKIGSSVVESKERAGKVGSNSRYDELSDLPITNRSSEYYRAAESIHDRAPLDQVIQACEKMVKNGMLRIDEGSTTREDPAKGGCSETVQELR